MEIQKIEIEYCGDKRHTRGTINRKRKGLKFDQELSVVISQISTGEVHFLVRTFSSQK